MSGSTSADVISLAARSMNDGNKMSVFTDSISVVVLFPATLAKPAGTMIVYADYGTKSSLTYKREGIVSEEALDVLKKHLGTSVRVMQYLRINDRNVTIQTWSKL